jgi:ubiquinone/menaquinone biosynthesis C-methylase UbiE
VFLSVRGRLLKRITIITKMPSERAPICDYEGSDYQTAFWEEGGREYEDQVEAVALRRLLPPSGKLLLEVGAGAGRNTPRYGGFEHVVLVDYSRTQLQQAQERLGASDRYTYVAANAYHLPFEPGLFDAATMIRTLHHMADPAAAIDQVRQALQPGAVFILEFANKRNLKAILRYVLRRQSWSPFTPQAVEFAKLNFDFHPRQLRAWLRENRFEVERQLTVSHFRMQPLKRLVPVKILVAMDSLAQWTGDLWQLSPSVFVRSRATGDSPIAQPGSFFRCPVCGHAPLKKQSQGMTCPNCAQEWRLEAGIYDFRVD